MNSGFFKTDWWSNVFLPLPKLASATMPPIEKIKGLANMFLPAFPRSTRLPTRG